MTAIRTPKRLVASVMDHLSVMLGRRDPRPATRTADGIAVQSQRQVRCKVCDGAATPEEIAVHYSFVAGPVKFRAPGMRCQECGLKFFTSEQALAVEARVERERPHSNRLVD